MASSNPNKRSLEPEEDEETGSPKRSKEENGDSSSSESSSDSSSSGKLFSKYSIFVALKHKYVYFRHFDEFFH